MKTRYTLLLILVASAIINFSCKKSSDKAQNNYTYLQGYWQGNILDASGAKGFGLLIKPGNVCRLYVNTNGATIDTTSGPVSFDETWSAANNTLTISGQLAQCTANLTQDQTILSGEITSQGNTEQFNFSLKKQ